MTGSSVEKKGIGSWLIALRKNESQLVILLSLVIGALVGLVVVAFILLTGRLAAHMYPAGGAGWRRILVPTVGALVTGWLLVRYFPAARGSGIPQTKFALFVEEGRIALRTVTGKFVCCSMSLASGIALGREGPSAHIGAGLASVIAQRLGLSSARVKSLVPVGCAAALAAAFNTPIAAVLFSLEEIMGDLHAPILGSVVLSSATAWMVLHLVLGDEPLFHVADYRLVHPAEFGIYAVLGVVGGLASVCFVKLLLTWRARFQDLPRSTTWLQPMMGGLVVGLIGFRMPEVLGVGYNDIERVLNGNLVITTVTALAILKIVATAMCYASGNAGGIFGPSLFIGAMIGGAVGGGAHVLFPSWTADAGAYALVGMGTAFAGIVRAPLTSVIMIFELTRDYTIIVPLMISNLIAFWVSHRLQRAPIYEALARQDGVHLPTESTRMGGDRLRVANAMRPPVQVLAPDMWIGTALNRLVQSGMDAGPLVDRGRFIGMVRRADLERASAGNARELPLVEALGFTGHQRGHADFEHLHPDQGLGLALERMGAHGQDVFPVVSRADVHQLVGVVTLRDVLSAYGVATAGEPSPSSPSLIESAVTLPSPRAVVTTFGIVFLSIVVLAASDISLARLERTETRAEALRLFREGQDLERAGNYTPAIDRFRSAVVLNRSESTFQLALGSALLDAGRLTEAGDALTIVLGRDPTDGSANLTMARVLSHQNRTAEAASYYHRAIYGHWTNGPTDRVRVRLELVDMLTRHGATRDVLGELLPLQDETRGDLAIQKRIGNLYLTAGAPDRALQVFQTILERSPNDADAHAGMGEAEFARANYVSAQKYFRTAARLAPGNDTVRRRLILCNDVITLHPTLRGLNARERYIRSMTLLERVLGTIERCVAEDQGADQMSAATIGRMRTAIEHGRRIQPSAEAAETNLDLAEEGWALHRVGCSQTPGGADEALARVMARLNG